MPQNTKSAFFNIIKKPLSHPPPPPPPKGQQYKRRTWQEANKTTGQSDNSRTRQKNNKTKEQQDNRATRQRDHNTTGELYNRTIRQQGTNVCKESMGSLRWRSASKGEPVARELLHLVRLDFYIILSLSLHILFWCLDLRKTSCQVRIFCLFALSGWVFSCPGQLNNWHCLSVCPLVPRSVWAN